MSSTLAPRLPETAWAHAAAAGHLEGVSWVDTRVESGAEPFSARELPEGGTLYSSLILEDYLPPAQVEAIRAAERRGFASLLHGLKQLIATPAWLIRTRALHWAPTSPQPLLLRRLIEAYGIGPELHKGDPQVLSCLAARVHHWYPHRGDLGATRRLVEEAGLVASAEDLLHRDDVGEIPRVLRDEVFACRDAHWWACRATPNAVPSLQIRDGLLRLQPRSGPGYVLLREDVLFCWTPEARQGSAVGIDITALRLLPAWTTLRVAAVESER